MNDEQYAIDIDHAHKEAMELISEEFFQACGDELVPFGSDEGDMALAEFQRLEKTNPTQLIVECLKWTIEGVAEMDFKNYNKELLYRKNA